MDYLQQLIERYPLLNNIRNDINSAYETVIDSFSKGGKLLIAGNGGSAADAEHIFGELIKSFRIKK
jgi:D-sedoheptulose 7-phosphate isomerase